MLEGKSDCLMMLQLVTTIGRTGYIKLLYGEPSDPLWASYPAVDKVIESARGYPSQRLPILKVAKTLQPLSSKLSQREGETNNFYGQAGG
ncbi:hypothetical protein FNV43_RR27186 [Rhamnella rubrinervis]|uniref:Uncharacterized protein n=1 Tax=Rhamnella rubrinervis TaxID=2594499 RepID=A0A8K0GPG2_9ROSA|nr:hypothetical protein FNV43_RR27186 [Rhamnella rubrinervis]